MAGVTVIEAALRLAATGVGILAILAPVLVLSRTWGNRQTDPVDAPNRAVRVIVTTLFLVLVGILLWHPLPLVLSGRSGIVITLLGSLLYFPAVGLYLWGLQTLGSVFRVSSAFSAALPPGHVIIEHGPYRFVRHPMYLGVILAALGASLIFRTWAMVLFFPLSFVVLARARQEEAALAKEHPETWHDYARRVPGWLPRSRRGPQASSDKGVDL